MTKVDRNPGARPVFDVHTPDAVKSVPREPQISTEIISKSKIETTNNPSLASKTVITKAKSENNTQILWKVAGVVMLAVSSIFLWHYLQAPPAVQNSVNIMATRNPSADPICLKTDNSFGNMCIDHNAVKSIHKVSNVEVSVDDNDIDNANSFDVNDILRLKDESVGCIFNEEAQDTHALKDVLKLLDKEEISLGLKRAEEFITNGKYDEARLATHKSLPWIVDSGGVKTTVKVLGPFVQNSQTLSTQIQDMRKLYDSGNYRICMKKA